MEKAWDQMRISKTLVIGDKNIALSLLDPDESSLSVFANLVASIGSLLLWRAKPPGNPDYFVDFDFVDNDLFAYTFSGYRMKLDIHNGSVIDTIFLK